MQHSTVVYVVECSFRTKDKLRTCNARTSTRWKKLWVSNPSWNSENLLHHRHIAARAGKSEAYIYGRLKLADLIPPVAEAFLKDTITIGHALLIAKLQASQQQEAFAAAFRSMWTSEGNTQVLIPVRELGGMD